ncbi:cation-transporting P-type ATPase PCA1 [Aspergillus vadensis CBS 113365]|uniref:HAD-like protein n=1 Tax=Aspergillus vadensis (strain CBS 113365 / IMI 142717 / IBT 24658) TaxID=1448311 RepID=A0A319AVF6_ASPVC|nr:hypothetical protein BO88DRAFT_458724 [Aspergillus vadensis CBS 113365]PYH63685.1 hypothetical protein BO88DRAFT_458724 [Aspergillus vadensis CBS 113365]
MALTVPEPKSFTGKGVETTVGGRRLQAGNSRWLDLSEHELVQPMLAQGYTVFCFSIDNALHAVFALEDELQPDAAGTIETLQKRGVSLSIPGNNVRSQSSPADKRDYIQMLLGTGADRKEPVVVFCGDGTNDAVALAQATIGVRMNEGTDVAQYAADVVSHAAFSGWHPHHDGLQSGIFLLVAGAFVDARISPQFAGLGELVSVLPVIAAALLLRWPKI